MADEAERPYHSTRRQEQSQETRRRLLDAARRLFAERGYVATSIPAIAQEAGVAVPTVYWAFGNKRALLMELVQTAVAGDTDPVPLAQRPWWQDMLQASEPADLLRATARVNRRIHERAAEVFEIVRGAAAADPEIAAMHRQGSENRRADCRAVVQVLTARGVLRPDVSEDRATDLLWSMSAPDWYRMLVIERGWSPDEYEEWMAETLVHHLLSSSP